MLLLDVAITRTVNITRSQDLCGTTAAPRSDPLRGVRLRCLAADLFTKVARKSAASESSLDIELNPAGTAKMIAFTQDLRPGSDRIAIMLDGKVLSAPEVNQVPLGPNFMAEGPNRPGEIDALLTTLKHPLKNRLTIEREDLIRPASGR